MTTDLNTGSSLYDSHNAIDAALTKLSNLGRLDDANPIIEDAAKTTNYAAIESDPELTHDAKLDRYSSAYTRTMDTVAQRLNRAATIASTQHDDDHAAAFGIVNPHLAASHRDAADRAAVIVSPRDRQAALAVAVADGDTVLAAALAKSAIANSDLASVNTFSDAFPHLDPPLQRLWDAAHSKNDMRQLGLAQYLAKDALRPGALNNVPAFQILTRAQRKAAVQ